MLKKSTLILLVISILFSSVIASAEGSFIDKKNIDNGVISINYKSEKPIAVKVIKDNIYYDYILNGNNDIPLQLGNGKYDILLLENVGGTRYRQITSESVELQIKNKYNLYLQSIQMINWNHEMQAIKKASELTKDLKSDGEKVEAIYNYIVNNIKYDYNKSSSANINYIPNIDYVLDTQTGICYDYSSLLAAMLRSQGIPTKLLMGRKNDIKEYHAWNQVYLRDINKWVTIDATYDAGFKKQNVKINMIKSDSQYKVEKVY